MTLSLPCRGRLAPSPTGLLHLGNAWAFLLAWLACRAEGGKLILRIEDIDPARSRPEFVAALIRDLQWLGLDWDEGPVAQSGRTALYEAALARLAEAGRIYPCFCTRRELREQHSLAGAPHVDERGAPYPGTCRQLGDTEREQRQAAGRSPCWRLRCPDASPSLDFTDALYGPQSGSIEDCGGDFALRRSDGVWAYQLAVVVDDGLMGITQVVRGHDILASTPRQLLLADWLGFGRPSYGHVPLLCDEYGERLAKRHQSLTLAALRDAGWTGEAVIGFLARQAMLCDKAAPIHPRELVRLFRFATLPRDPVLLPPERELLKSCR